MSLRIFVTGGTFSKEYDPIMEKFLFRETSVPEMLDISRITIPTELKTLMMVDSLEMTVDQRNMILDACEKEEYERIVIIHGTGTMDKTAELLASRITDKTIVLTGAMVPYRYTRSDAMFNLGCAIAYAESLPHGVYVTMNGKYFPAGTVKKNVQTGIFESLV